MKKNLRKFDTKIQHLKYKVRREVARYAWRDELLEKITEIPKIIVPGKESTTRCCIYKERAIINEQIKVAMGGNRQNPNVIEVIGIACDECPVGGYEVTDTCRGCLAHRCEEACPKGAITFDTEQKAHIDKSKCVECGACSRVCPYNAITVQKRPCWNACKVGAISMTEDRIAYIDNDACISCGACVYQCPFGAILDKSFILDVISLLKESHGNTDTHVYAVVAPSISSQFQYAKLGQVLAGIEALGFYKIEEAALGADMVAFAEAKELTEKGFLMSSCCPAFVAYVHKKFPQFAENISHSLSPVATISKYIKEQDEKAKVVFIGPCTAKKMEFQKPEVRPYIDSVITFEELQSLFDSRDIDITMLPEAALNRASYYGRIFAKSCGLSSAIAQGLIEQNAENFSFQAVPCDGIAECKVALLKAAKNRLDGNFVEGMACVGGCIGGAGCLTHAERNKLILGKYSKESEWKTIEEALDAL